jgi:uncharacterized protein YozE (UPF0346 family)
MTTPIDPNVGRDNYHQWVSENDSYPKHSHQYIVSSYVGSPKRFYRNFGPFDSQDDAMGWMREYIKKYTTKGFITEYRTMPVCEVLPACGGEVAGALKEISSNLLENQGKLDPDFERTLRDNLWDLYDS